jgi:TonB family protein
MSPSDIRLDPAGRSLPSRAGPSPAEPSRYIAPVAVGLVYAIILALLVFENQLDGAVAPETVTIPVEIVVEPPPEKPDSPAPNPEPQPTAPPILEQPASDAPHAANNEKTDAEGADETAKPPAAESPAKPPSASPDHGEAGEPTRQGEPVQPNENPDGPVFTEPAPVFDFGSLFKQTPIAGGQANSTYLSILYGAIVPHMHLPPGSRANWPKLEGTLAFSVDRRGNLMQRRVLRQSGSHDLDAAALAALAEGSPFPPPPKGIPLEFTFTYVAE